MIEKDLKDYKKGDYWIELGGALAKIEDLTENGDIVYSNPNDDRFCYTTNPRNGCLQRKATKLETIKLLLKGEND